MFKLLILSPTPTHPTNAGNRARIRTWLETCAEAGVDFHLAFFRQEPGDEAAMINAWGADHCTFLNYQLPRRTHTIPQRLLLRIAGIFNRSKFFPYCIDDICGDSLFNEVQQLAQRIKPTCVQIEYVFFSRLFECFDRSVFKILDTHDVVAGRERMFLKQGRAPEWFYTTRRQEAIGVARADCVVAIQEEEKVYFQALTRNMVVMVGHQVELHPQKSPATLLPTIVFIGSANTVNQDALDFLLHEIWPLIKAAVPDANLEIYGKVSEFANNPSLGVRVEGEIVDISEAYNRAWLVVCPLRFGTGLKIKSIEALGRGKALVCTQAGSTGLEDGDGKAFLKGDSAESFAGHCIKILTDSVTRNDLEQAAYDYAAAWNFKQHRSLLDVLTLAGFHK